jgi:hypothetical protein
MVSRNFGEFCFWYAADIQLETDSAGRLIEYTHTLPLEVPLNRHAAGPFCRFRAGKLPVSAGVYAIVVGEDLKYIGRCENLERRFGPAGYGVIHARNLHSNGQSANCKINSRVLAEVKSGNAVAVYFHESRDRYFEVEAALIALLAPPWNDRREPVTRTNRPGDKDRTLLVSDRHGSIKASFLAALNDEFDGATALGQSLIRINARELHEKVGGYPKPNRMPICCSAMYDAMGPHDRVIDSPRKGKGASLTIEYRLPRP